MTRLELRGRRALVTGAGQRVGRAIALRLGAEGMRVALHCNASVSGAENTLAALRALGSDGLVLQADLTSRDAARTLVDAACAALGGLDLLVASAASFERIALGEVDDAAWDRSLGLNLGSQFALAQRALPALRQSRGSIVFVTCSSATTPFRNYLPYVVSKGALRHLTRALALECAPEVRVNAVAPGAVLPPANTPTAALERIVSRIPLARLGEADDVAEAVVYLASAPFVTGHELVVDGGRTVAGLDTGAG
ncbi:MAG TPA: SDR family oxidoreductase [Polyangiaceae bacterium]|nr:SDR family oxidoreductase [Polyangiaceae bacterium]